MKLNLLQNFNFNTREQNICLVYTIKRVILFALPIVIIIFLEAFYFFGIFEEECNNIDQRIKESSYQIVEMSKEIKIIPLSAIVKTKELAVKSNILIKTITFENNNLLIVGFGNFENILQYIQLIEEYTKRIDDIEIKNTENNELRLTLNIRL